MPKNLVGYFRHKPLITILFIIRLLFGMRNEILKATDYRGNSHDLPWLYGSSVEICGIYQVFSYDHEEYLEAFQE